MPGKSISQFLVSVGALTLEDIDQEIARAYDDPGVSRLLEAARMVIFERDSRVSSARTDSPLAPHVDRPHDDHPHLDRPHSDHKQE
jgi:hypothetical protein